MPPSSTSRTTVPLVGNLGDGESSGFAGAADGLAEARTVGSFCVRAAGITCVTIATGFVVAGAFDVSPASAISNGAPR